MGIGQNVSFRGNRTSVDRVKTTGYIASAAISLSHTTSELT